jgi:hypothetical protein
VTLLDPFTFFFVGGSADETPPSTEDSVPPPRFIRREGSGSQEEDPYALWYQFLEERYEGGRKMVENTNPKSKDTHPQVQMATRMKHDLGYRKKVYQEFLDWKEKKTSQEEPLVAEAPSADQTVDPVSIFSPSTLEDSKPELTGGKSIQAPLNVKEGDIVKYYDSFGNVMMGHVVDHAGDWFDVQPLDPKTGAPAGEGTTYFDADSLPSSGMIKIPPSKHPAKIKKYLEGLEEAESDSSPSSSSPEEPNHPKKVTSPQEVEVGQYIAYSRKGKDLIGKVISHSGDKFYVQVLDPKTGKSADHKPRHFTAERMKEFGAVLMPGWQPPVETAPTPPSKPAPPPSDLHMKPSADVDAEGWTVIGGQGGATDGASYEAPDGTRYYVKTPDKVDHIRNEMLANALYREAGIDVPELSLVMRHGKPSIASKWVQGLKLDPEALKSGNIPGVAEGFAMDAFLANWDVAGQPNKSFQNMPIGPDGKVWRIDAGGALQYHGVLSPKGSAFGNQVKELKDFLSPTRSKSKIYQHVTPEETVKSIDRVLAISESRLEEIVQEHYPDDTPQRQELIAKLKARRKDLEDQRARYLQNGKQAARSRVLCSSSPRPPLPQSFFEFLKVKYGPLGGSTKVTNFTDTRDRFPKIEVWTLLKKDKPFRDRLLAEYKRWRASSAESTDQSSPQLDVDQEGWVQIGKQGGSNPGGLYQAPDGEKWYVKTPRSPDHAKNEILSAKLYEAAGVPMPEIVPAKRNGQYSVASRIVPGLREDQDKLVQGQAKGVLEHIATDAWLANWDVVGLTYDNMLLDDNNVAHRIDTGGALLYRAMGAPKGSQFGPKVKEFEAFLDPSRKAGSVFHHAKPQDLIESIDRVLKIPRDEISALVQQFGPGGAEDKKYLQQTLEGRREHLKAIRDFLLKKEAGTGG